MDSRVEADMLAGWAVGEGALVAGELRKRSDWRHDWNPRFAILTTDELCWFPPARVRTLRCASWRFDAGSGERRSMAIGSRVQANIRPDGRTGSADDDILVLSCAGTTLLSVRATSAAELRAWREAIESVVLSLQADERIARAFVRERQFLFSARHFEPAPHIGSRNHRERTIRKTWYSCARAKGKAPTLGGRVDNDTPHASHFLLSLTTLPPTAASWNDDQCSAFREILDEITSAGHPSIAPPALVELCIADGRLVTAAPYMPSGSLRDLLHRVRARPANLRNQPAEPPTRPQRFACARMADERRHLTAPRVPQPHSALALLALAGSRPKVAVLSKARPAVGGRRTGRTRIGRRAAWRAATARRASTVSGGWQCARERRSTRRRSAGCSSAAVGAAVVGAAVVFCFGAASGAASSQGVALRSDGAGGPPLLARARRARRTRPRG